MNKERLLEEQAKSRAYFKALREKNAKEENPKAKSIIDELPLRELNEKYPDCVNHLRRYPTVVFNGVSMYLARKIFYETHGYFPQVVRHSCDNPHCINPAHLLPGTHADNVKDRVERKRSAIGERNGRAKLTEDQVKSIRKSRLSKRALSLKYGVDRRIIRLIKEKKIWKSVS